METNTRVITAALMLMLPATIAATPAPGSRPDTTRARELREQAESYFATPSRWAYAADLLRESAEHLDEASPEQYQTLVTAARVFGQAGKLNSARKTFEEAAQSALARGALVEAAQAYVDAAHVAARQGKARLAVELTSRARLLADSPHLSSADRNAILSFARVV